MSGFVEAIYVPSAGDLSSSFNSFKHALERFGDQLASIGWTSLAIALALSLALQLCRARAWTNAVRAAYPNSKFRRAQVVAAFLIGSGMNGVLPAKGGEALKIVLAKRSVPDSAYPTIISSFAVMSPFDTLAGICVLIYASTQGLLPRLPRIPRLPAFEISFWADHPYILLGTVAGLLAIVTALVIALGRRVEEFWGRLRQGVSILTDPPRYLREVVSWQAIGWVLRFASFWLFLDAFHIGGSFQTVLLVMSVQAIAGALPFTPGGAGSQQALLVATLAGPSHAAVLAYSVGQQVAVTAFSVAVAVIALVFVFRTKDWRGLIREGREATDSPSEAPG